MRNSLEQAYNNLSYTVKEDVGFPMFYLYLTTKQERFVSYLFDIERKEIKKELLETVQEIKELVDAI